MSNNNWISIKDKKPPVDTNVLLTNNDSKYIDNLWVVAGHMDKNGEYWNQFQDKYSDTSIIPTHWQPLPEPPKNKVA